MSHLFTRKHIISICLFAVFVFSFACVLTVVPRPAHATANDSIDTKSFTDQIGKDLGQLIRENMDQGSSSGKTKVSQQGNTVQNGQSKTTETGLHIHIEKNFTISQSGTGN